MNLGLPLESSFNCIHTGPFKPKYTHKPLHKRSICVCLITCPFEDIPALICNLFLGIAITGLLSKSHNTSTVYSWPGRYS